MMCAWSESADACLGDSGGPLTISGGGADSDGADDVQVGIVSFGVGCNSPDFPGLYSRISDQIGWIDEVVCKLSDDPPADFECVGETASPTRRPTTVPPTGRPTLRPSSAPVVTEKQQSVLEFLLGDDSQDGSGDDGDDEEEDSAGSMPMASPTVLPAMDPTDPPFAADLVWFDDGDAVDISTPRSVESQMQGDSESSNDDGLILIIAASVGGVALVALLAVMAVLISKRRKERKDDSSERSASLCIRVLQHDATCETTTTTTTTTDHRGRQRSSGEAANYEGEPSVEIVADA